MMKKTFTLEELEKIIERLSFDVSAVDCYASVWKAIERDTLLMSLKGENPAIRFEKDGTIKIDEMEES